MPSLSPTMTEGTIVKWCFKVSRKDTATFVLISLCYIYIVSSIKDGEWSVNSIDIFLQFYFQCGPMNSPLMTI